jgi:hypothetical protein
MTPAPKRRWFQWSLRTLFVVVTVFGCWLGYELNWIRQRHRYLEDQADLRARFPGAIQSSAVPVDAPGFLWLFGERGHGGELSILVLEADPGHFADIGAEIAKARSLFPEIGSCLVTVVRP